MEIIRKICIILCLGVSPLGASPLFAGEAQEPVVAGAFYPADKAALKRMVDEYIELANPEPIKGDIVALVAPHAGYIYSGPVAGYAFKLIKDKPYKTAIVIAPSHHSAFDGLSILDKDSYITPLGEVAIDKEITGKLLAFDKRIRYHPQAFLKEHAAEVEIPFLQESLKDFKLVVILMGAPSHDNCVLLGAALAEAAKGRNDIIIIASSDMSHFYPDDKARKIDNRTLSEIEKYDPESLFLEMATLTGQDSPCGFGGIVGVMMAAKELGADKVKILRYANSGDTAGDKRSVVGYGAAVVYRSTVDSPSLDRLGTLRRGTLSDVEGQLTVKNEAKKESQMKELLNIKQKKRLLQIARETMETYIKERKTLQFKEDDPVLNKEMGAFVTLHKKGDLRGCIGNMIGKGPLCLTICDMAIASSTQDPRFSPVKASELKDIDIEISVLSPMEKIDDPNKIIMGTHGVMVRSGFRSGVYLPQVATETGWSREEFMNSLCLHKAGLPADSWKTGICDIYVFTAEVFGEKELKE